VTVPPPSLDEFVNVVVDGVIEPTAHAYHLALGRGWIGLADAGDHPGRGDGKGIERLEHLLAGVRLLGEVIAQREDDRAHQPLRAGFVEQGDAEVVGYYAAFGLVRSAATASNVQSSPCSLAICPV
jgi:hypothetical protein